MEDNRKIKKEQPLYICEFENSVEELKKLSKVFPKITRVYYILFIVILTILNLLISPLCYLMLHLNGFIMFAIIEISFIIILNLKLDKTLEQTWTKILSKRKNKSIITEFYDDYFTREFDNIIYKHQYKEIVEAIETNSNIYLKTEKYIYNIKKDCCDLKLIEYVRIKVDNIESRLGDEIKFTAQKKARHPKLFKVLMTLLFVLSILSFIFSVVIEVVLGNIQSSAPNCNTWIYLLFLPIPIVSILLGLYFKNNRYENLKIDYKLNIVSGIIVTILLFLLGYNYYIPLSDSEMNTEYKEIAKIEFPNKSLRQQKEFIGLVSEKTKWEYTFVISNFTKSDGEKFQNQITKSDKWILNPKLDSSYMNNRPIKLKINQDTYVLNYDSSNDEYNTFSSETGTHYIFTYDVSSRHLEIHKYYLLNRSQRQR